MQRLPIALLIFLICTSFTAQAAKTGQSIFDRWSHVENVKLELRVNFDEIEANRKSLTEMRATLVDANTEFSLSVSVRGKYRRRTCAMPPLKLQFDKSDLRLAGLNTHNDYKLVTHCTDDEAGQDALLREQLAYEMYNTINPEASFRTKLLTITYVNTVDGSTTTSYAILIEDTDELKGRLNADNCSDCYSAPLSAYANAETMTLFQYMIGNADYSTNMVRNLKAMRTANGQITAVPYDFDFSGLVDPSYAVPNRPGQTSMKDRVLVWEFSQPSDAREATDLFIGLEQKLMNQIDGFEELSNGSRREVSKYVKNFYKELKDGDIKLAPATVAR